MDNILLKLINRFFMFVVYGDLLMKVLYRVRLYEKVIGSVNVLYEKWVDICKFFFVKVKIFVFIRNIKDIVKEFDNLEILDIKKLKVGLVGEILVKFYLIVNNNLVDILEWEGVEVVVLDFINFFLSCVFNIIYKYIYLEGSRKSRMIGEVFIYIIGIY